MRCIRLIKLWRKVVKGQGAPAIYRYVEQRIAKKGPRVTSRALCHSDNASTSVSQNRLPNGGSSSPSDQPRPITWQAFDTLPNSSARFSRPVLCLIILSVVFNIVVSFDGSVCTSIKTDNHHLTQEMCRPHFSLLRRGRCQITSRLIQVRLSMKSSASFGTALP